MKNRLIASAALLAACATSAPALAQEVAASAASNAATNAADFDKFVPRPAKQTALDYAIWQDALQYMVLRMGLSTRDGATRPDPTIGSRRVWGHDSRVRLEGNRIPFSLMDEAAIATFTEYRQDLEQIGAQVDIASLPRSEQLAYWINLHNVAVIEQIALNYPVKAPSRLLLGENETPLDVTPFITVGGVAMSPKDIRTRIVYPNWKDPKVIYGFFRGDVGSPSIQREAHTADNVDRLLLEGANEFVNSLRGVEGYGKNLLVSAIYEEAAPFYFPQMGDDLKAHLSRYAEEEVKELLASKPEVKVNQYEETVADLAGGQREPTYNTVYSDGQANSFRIPSSVARYLGERAQKYEKLRKEGRTGRVFIMPGDGTDLIGAEDEETQEDQPAIETAESPSAG
ncbi:DUF547 domain-containing protein [Qipengyuania seohaensis]|uniref:DUF547 domain-containing protein n=1 Tax=Qipengyuania seohaensis TaxID=266951 RepID=UPI001E548C10|nr:DUF547 domain-containing protein [Qipengyuania seohaensis]